MADFRFININNIQSCLLEKYGPMTQVAFSKSSLGKHRESKIRQALQENEHADKYVIEINRINLDLYIRSPYYIGASYWNELPKPIRRMRVPIAKH